MEPVDILFWSLVGLLGIVTLNPWGWTSNKPVEMQEKNLDDCRCFWCSK